MIPTVIRESFLHKARVENLIKDYAEFKSLEIALKNIFCVVLVGLQIFRNNQRRYYFMK